MDVVDDILEEPHEGTRRPRPRKAQQAQQGSSGQCLPHLAIRLGSSLSAARCRPIPSIRFLPLRIAWMSLPGSLYSGDTMKKPLALALTIAAVTSPTSEERRPHRDYAASAASAFLVAEMTCEARPAACPAAAIQVLGTICRDVQERSKRARCDDPRFLGVFARHVAGSTLRDLRADFPLTVAAIERIAREG